MARLRTAAVVLKVLDHGESDKIVTFYCRGSGKLTGIAKGAKRSSRRFVNKLEIFSWLEITYETRRQTALVQIIEAELLQAFIGLRTDYQRYVVASLFMELTLHWSRENDSDEQFFRLLTWALTSLNHGQPPLQVVIFFLARLYQVVGYRPDFSGCGRCHRADPAAAPFAFQPAGGGLICQDCVPGAGLFGSIRVSLPTARLLASAQALELAKLQRLRFSPASTREALSLLNRYGEHLLQREICSWTALAEVFHLQAKA